MKHNFHNFLSSNILRNEIPKLVNLTLVSGEVEIIPSKISRTPSRVGWSLVNILFTNDEEYVPIVVTTTPSYFILEYDLPNKTYHRVCTNMSNTKSATCGAGSAYPAGAPKIIPGIRWASCCSVFSFYVVFCILLNVLSFFFFFVLALSVYFRLMSFNVPLASFASLVKASESIYIVSKLHRKL